MYSLQAELAEEQDPNKVDIAKNDTAAEGHDQANDKAKKTALLCEGGPSDDQLGYPVHKGNQEKQKLYQSALFVKPSHVRYLHI